MTGLDLAIENLRQGCDVIDWNHASQAYARGKDILVRASDAVVLSALVDQVSKNPRLLNQCQRFNLFTKLVLLEGRERKWKLRLHVFEPPVLEAHHHRASFCARVLRGRYTHMLFGAHNTLDLRRLEMPLHPLFVQHQEPGVDYFIDHEMVHSTLAEERTVSMMLQGPTVRESFEIFELETGQLRVRKGGCQVRETQEPGEAPMTNADVRRVRGGLRDMGLLG